MIFQFCLAIALFFHDDARSLIVGDSSCMRYSILMAISKTRTLKLNKCINYLIANSSLVGSYEYSLKCNASIIDD